MNERVGIAWDWVVETFRAAPDIVLLMLAVALFALGLWVFRSPS